MHKIVIAVDSFKGCLSSIQIADAIQEAILKVCPSYEIIKAPIADGGEGTVDVLVQVTNGKYIKCQAHNPLMQKIEASYGIIYGNTAIIEVASASGLPLIKPYEYNPMLTTSFGTGELIKAAINRGYRNFIIGVGGSATNDAGLGLLQALGYRFYNKQGHILDVGGKILNDVEHIDDSNVLSQLKDCKFKLACDVNATFYGANGAARIFAPQKGANSQMVEALDQGMQHLSKIIYQKFNIDLNLTDHSGAAGGLAGILHAFFCAELLSGIDLILETMHFNELIKNADLIITGEGKIDKQSLMGKALLGILKYAKTELIPIIAIAGAVENKQDLIAAGLKNVYRISPTDMPLSKAMQPDVALSKIKRTITDILDFR